MKLAGKVALVAGGASGLGEACVRRLVAQKTKVMILDMDEAKGTKLADELGTSDALFVKTDITNPEQVAGALELSKSKLGSFHIAINCVGIAVGAKGSRERWSHGSQSLQQGHTSQLDRHFQHDPLGCSRNDGQ